MPGATPLAQPCHPLPPECLGMRQPRTSLPSPEHTGTVGGTSCCPKSQVSVGSSPDAHGSVTSCGTEKAGADLGMCHLLKGRMRLAPSPPIPPGPLAGATAPCVSPHPAASRRCPPPWLCCPTAIGPTVQCRAPPACAGASSPQELSCPVALSLAGGKERSPWGGSARLSSPAGSAWQGWCCRDINGPKYIPGEERQGTSLKF